jgi:4-amino-4-deoxy-L-arabinose transferase-like glycosyltransferase
VYSLALTISRSRVSALFAAFLWMTYPLALWLTKQPNSESPFLLLTYLAIWLYWQTARSRLDRYWPYGLVGVLLGVATLIRPVALGLCAFLGVLVFVLRKSASWKRNLLFAICLLLGQAVAILPWELWVYHKTGEIILLSRSGSAADGVTFAAGSFYGQFADRVPSDVHRLMEDFNAGFVTRTRGEVLAMVWDEFRRRPVTVAKLFAIKGVRCWYGTDSGRLEGLIVLVQVLYLMFALLCIAAAVNDRSESRGLALLSLAVVAYFWLMALTAIPIVRYMVPAMGMLFSLSPCGLGIARSIRSRAAILRTHAAH